MYGSSHSWGKHQCSWYCQKVVNEAMCTLKDIEFQIIFLSKFSKIGKNSQNYFAYFPSFIVLYFTLLEFILIYFLFIHTINIIDYIGSSTMDTIDF